MWDASPSLSLCAGLPPSLVVVVNIPCLCRWWWEGILSLSLSLPLLVCGCSHYCCWRVQVGGSVSLVVALDLWGDHQKRIPPYVKNDKARNTQPQTGQVSTVFRLSWCFSCALLVSVSTPSTCSLVRVRMWVFSLSLSLSCRCRWYVWKWVHTNDNERVRVHTPTTARDARTSTTTMTTKEHKHTPTTMSEKHERENAHTHVNNESNNATMENISSHRQ